MTIKKCIAAKPIPYGSAVSIVGLKRKYCGELLKPRTWLKFEKVAIIAPIETKYDSI